MKIDDDFMKNFRWITPLLLTCLLGMMGWVVSEMRALRLEIAEVRQFGVQYTDKMVELILVMKKERK